MTSVLDRPRTLFIPQLLGALAVVALAITASGSPTSEAATDGPAMALEVAGQRGKADIRIGNTFKVSVIADGIPLTNGYILAQAWLEYGTTGLIGKDSAITWPDCEAAELDVVLPFAAFRGCLTGLINPPVSFYKGELFTFDFNCPNEKGSHKIDLIPSGTAPAGTNGAAFTDLNLQLHVPEVQGIDINCVDPQAVGGLAFDNRLTPLGALEERDHGAARTIWWFAAGLVLVVIFGATAAVARRAGRA